MGIAIGVGIEVGMTGGSVKNSRGRGGLCILYRTYTGGEAPPITAIQNTQAPPEFLTLPQVIPTSIPTPIPIPI